MKLLFTELMIEVIPIAVYEDNMNVINWIRDISFRSRTKHLGVQLNSVREAEEEGSIAIEWISGKDQNADAFTNPLARQLFERFINRVGCVDDPKQN